MRLEKLSRERNKINKLIWRGIIVLIALAGFLFWHELITFEIDNKNSSGILPGMYSGSVTPSATPTSSIKPTSISTPTANHSKLISVVFTSQAPYAIWDQVHNEACEEATIVMANVWMHGLSMTQAYAEQEIQRLTQWGIDTLNTYDTTARETARMAKEVYGIDSRVIDNPTLVELKGEIDRGNIIVIGMAGQLLDNPNFRPPGPLYHMILIKGYDANGFIVNDPGTRNGNSYHYSYDTILNAAHDWNGSKEAIYSSDSAAIIFSK